MISVVGLNEDSIPTIFLQFEDREEALDNTAFFALISRIGNRLQRVVYDDSTGIAYLWSTSGMFDGMARDFVVAAMGLPGDFEFSRIRTYEDF